MEGLPGIEKLLPHQPPMRLLDAVFDADTRGLWATVLLRADSPFMVHGRVRSLVALEYLAQAAAAWFGWQAAQGAGGTVRPGMLIACSRLDSRRSHFETGECLWLRAEPVSRLPVSGSGMVKFRGQVFVLAEAAPSARPPADEPLMEHDVFHPRQRWPGASRVAASVEAEFSVYL